MELSLHLDEALNLAADPAEASAGLVVRQEVVSDEPCGDGSSSRELTEVVHPLSQPQLVCGAGRLGIVHAQLG